MAERVSSPVFVGRVEELSTLHAALERAAGNRSQTVLLAGESGVGKTRLLNEFRRGVGESETRWLSGECIAVAEGELPYAPITAALRTIAAELEALDVTPESTPELARLLPKLGSARAPNLSPSADEAPRPPVGSEFAQGRLFEQILSLFADLSSERPVVLAVEDLHWADRSTRDLLAFLIRTAREEALLLVCTYRSDELHRRHPLRPFLAEHRRRDSVELLELRPFTQSELVAQLEGILGAAPASEFAGRLFERCEGNAFFSEELVAASSAGDERLPATLRDALLLRVEALSAPTQEVLRAAAAAGRRVPHPLLAAVAGVPEQELTAALREAVAHQLLVQDTERDSYAFRHALLAEAIGADLLPGERTRLHLALAEALTADPGLAAGPGGNAAELAFHWRASHRLEDALSASVEAGLEAESSCAFAEANRQFENALELWDRVEDAERRAGMDHPATLLRAAENASLSGRAERAVALARSMVSEIDAAEESTRAGLARERLGIFLWLSGDSDGAIAALREAVDLLPAEPPSAERARVLSAEGRILMLHGRPDESRSRCEEAIDIARRTGERAEEGRALNTLGCDVLLLGDRERAMEYLREAMRIAEDCSPGDLWRAYGNLAEAFDQDGRVEEGVRLGIEGAEVARGLGQRSWRGWLLGHAALRLVRLGRLDEAARFGALGLEVLQEGIDAAVLYSAAAEVDLHRGNLEEARRTLERAAEAAGPTSDVEVRAILTDRPAEVAVVGGDPDRAATLVDEAIAGLDGDYVFHTARLHAVGVRAHADRAERARALGDERTTAEAVHSGTALVERLGRLLEPGRWLVSPPPDSVARAALAAAELARAAGASDAETWRSVGRRWKELGYPLELAYARWREAEAILAGGGTRAEGAEPLREAARLTADAGASLLGAEVEALSRRARVELGDAADAASSTTRAGPETERFGLTGRELDVLALVVDGRTNREIGEALFISTKTASAHVSHILSKLEVRSRVEAATAAHRLGLVPRVDERRAAHPPGGHLP